MRLAWAWLVEHSPVVVARRSTMRRRERNAFQLGRDNVRATLGLRVDLLEAQAHKLLRPAEEEVPALRKWLTIVR